jgi:hypothetical protein
MTKKGGFNMSKWSFTCRDNGGKFQALTISAGNKTDAINKGFEKARKTAKGDITSWNCSLKRA